MTPPDIEATVDAIARGQLDDGRIPWFSGHHTDPWNHVEAAMALAVGGRHHAVERAYGWLRATQRDDGSWPSYVIADAVTDPTVDANFCAYLAAGLWHHTVLTRSGTLPAGRRAGMGPGGGSVLTPPRPAREIHLAGER